MSSSPKTPYPTLKNKSIDQWKVTELKEELRRRKVSTKGLKEDLISRLRDCINEDLEISKKEIDLLKNVSDDDTVKDNKLIKEDQTENQNINAEIDFIVVDNEESKNTAIADQEDNDLVENIVATADLNVPLEDKSPPSIPVESNEDNEIMQGGEKSQHDEDSDEKKEKEIDEKSDKIINYNENDKTNKDLEPLSGESGDIDLNQSEQNSQVSEVKTDLGFPVTCDSISIDSVSINETNKLKDNLNAANFHLEPKVVKTESVQPSSADVAPIVGDLHPDRDYSEKLNLDRSSGDESMEEYMPETKQILSNINPEINEDVVNMDEIDLKEPSQSIDVSGGLSSILKKDDAKEENKTCIKVVKRKSQAKESVQTSVSSKRHRSWKIETETDSKQPLSILTSSTTSNNLCRPIPKRIFRPSDAMLNGDLQKIRKVPPSQKPPTNSLRIDNFLRPFTLKAVQELLGKTGTVCSFWMDNIKTHCYVTYSSEEEAVKTRDAVYNLQWPANGGRLLMADFTDPEQVKKHVESLIDSHAPVTPYKQNQNLQWQHDLSQQLPPPPPLLPLPPPPPPMLNTPLERPILPLQSSNPEPPILTLDDIFIKTKTIPRVYYLPLSEDQVAAKKLHMQRG